MRASPRSWRSSHTTKGSRRSRRSSSPIDLFSGSPYNASATLALKGEVSDVIAGMSLPICLVLAEQAATGQQNTSAAVAAVADQAQTFTRILSRQTQNEEDEDLS